MLGGHWSRLIKSICDTSIIFSSYNPWLATFICSCINVHRIFCAACLFTVSLPGIWEIFLRWSICHTFEVIHVIIITACFCWRELVRDVSMISIWFTNTQINVRIVNNSPRSCWRRVLLHTDGAQGWSRSFDCCRSRRWPFCFRSFRGFKWRFTARSGGKAKYEYHKSMEFKCKQEFL